MNKHIKDNWLIYLILLALGLYSILVFKACTHVTVVPTARHTIDTVYIDKPYKVVEIKTVHVPVKVLIYKDRDTTLRKDVEKKPIIIDVKIKPGEVDITTIDTTGKIKTEVHVIDPDSPEVIIDNIGQVEVKQKTKAGKILQKVWKGTKTGLMIVGGVTVAVLAVKYL